MNWTLKVFNYLKPLWEGPDKKISINRCLAILFAWKVVTNADYIIRKWEQGRSAGDASTILLTLAGLIPVLLGITAWSNMAAKKIDTDATMSPDTVVKTEKAEISTVGIGNNKGTNKKQTDTTTTTTSTEAQYNPPLGDA